MKEGGSTLSVSIFDAKAFKVLDYLILQLADLNSNRIISEFGTQWGLNIGKTKSSFVHPSIGGQRVINGASEDKEWNKYPTNHGIKIHKLRKNNPYFTEFSRNPLLFNKLFVSLHPRIKANY